MTQLKDEKVVILCGGMGTRLREETEYRPKAMIEIGGRPILWHVLRTYYFYGYRKFVLCLGYKGSVIKEYFLNYQSMRNDFTLQLRTGRQYVFDARQEVEDWEITFVDTGAEAQTGARLFRVRKHIQEEFFLANYCDGLSDIDVNQLVDFHKAKKKMATLSGFHARSRFGVVKANDHGIVNFWQEKPLMHDLIPGGFFVFNRGIFDYLNDDDNCVLERDPLEKLARDEQLALYPHDGFWYCMDTFKEALALNEMARSKDTPWMIWDR